MRQSLSDITNSQSLDELSLQEPSEHVNRLKKENAALVKLLKNRDKTIELSRDELRNLREDIHKLQVQNWSLAQSNSQFLGVINLAKNKVKALHHEITCKNALLKAKFFEQERGEHTLSNNAIRTENVTKMTGEDSDLQKPVVPNRRRFIRSKSFGASSINKIEADKEKYENKRRRSRRRSAAQEVTENLFEIEDLQLMMPNDMTSQKDNPTMESRTRKKQEEEEDIRICKIHRSPVYRPLLREAGKIHSYKEVSLSTKMRRS